MDVKRRLQITPFDFFVVRRPHFPVDFLFGANENGDEKQNAFAALFKSYILAQPEFLSAIQIASPVLFERTRKWINDEKVSEEESLIKTLYKYWGRMCSRATPYGLFSGIALANWGECTSLKVDKKGDRISVDLDVLVINRLAELALLDDNVVNNLLFFTNNSIYKVGDGFRYVEYDLDQGRREYFLSSIRNFRALEPVLMLARDGCYLRDLRKALLSVGYSLPESEECIRDLIDLKIIQNEFETQLAGNDSLNFLLEKLKSSHAEKPLLTGLGQIAALLNSDGNLSVKSLDTVRDLVSSLLPDTADHVQIQLTLQQGYKHAQVGSVIKDRIERDLVSLAPMFAKRSKSALRDFKKQFNERYGEAEMPLSIILDGELGIDYGGASMLSSTPVLDGVELVPLGENPKEFAAWDQFLLDVYLRHLENESDCINLIADDLNAFTALPATPPSFYAIGNLFKAQAGQDIKFSLNHVGGSSGIALLSRFATSNSELKGKLEEIAEYEQQSYQHAVLAEIIFLPESRTANVLSHPPFYSFEIPFITRSAAPAEFQLPVSDLMVSVKGGKQVVLRSKRLGKQIIPRLSNAHNYSSELPLYRFLCDIQTDSNDIYFSWDWSFLENRPVLPRVVYNSLLLSRKRWNVALSWAGRVEEFIQQYNVPRYVQLIDRDNEMLLDLDLPIARSVLTDEIKKKGKAELREFLSMPEQCVISDEKGHSYANELIIPFKTIDFKSKSWAYVPVENVTRKFEPGDEWLYVKIYSGPTILDKLLTDTIKDFAADLIAKGIIDKWFFIRYQDPFTNLRLRFHNASNPQFAGLVLDALKPRLAEMRGSGMIERFVIDTYDRELERYGAANIEVAEMLFFLDSELVVNVLKEIGENDLNESRWLYACAGIHAMLEAFGLDLNQKLALITVAFDNFLSEYQHADKVAVQLNNKYRTSRQGITSLIEQYEQESEDPIVRLFVRHSLDVRANLLNANARFSEDQIRAFLHMFCNRLLIGESRGQELLIYHSLSKFYNGREARVRKAKTGQ